MKRSLLASAAAVLVSSVLIASPAAAAETSIPESVLPANYQVQPVNKSAVGVTQGMGHGSKIFWCNWWGYFC